MKNAHILNIILAICLLLLLIKLNTNSGTQSKTTGYEEALNKEVTTANKPGKPIKITHQAWVKLTVSESKRLIAKGLKKYPPVAQKMENGQIIIARGTTNTYVAEELLNDSIYPGEFVTGRISPAKSEGLKKFKNKIPEIVIVDGEPKELVFTDALDATRNLDIVLKGANILNYTQGKAAVLIGHPTGGTIGQILPRMKDEKIRLIIPVGLEKNSSFDLLSVSNKLQQKPINTDKKVPELWLLPGEVFTEIEAIQQFANVEITQIGSGGIAGAEGAVSLLIRGEENDVNHALEVVRSIQGEPSFKEKY